MKRDLASLLSTNSCDRAFSWHDLSSPDASGEVGLDSLIAVAEFGRLELDLPKIFRLQISSHLLQSERTAAA